MVINSKYRSKKIAVCSKKLPPCNNACPAGEDIQHWLSLVKKKQFHQAWATIVADNPFPAIHGRVCYHYCETRCSRIQYDSTVSIHCVERFLGDLALDEEWSFKPVKKSTGKRILVVGAGPAGLSAAYQLTMMGHKVVIYEALSKPGGTMLTGIPAYRLPRKILFGEIERIVKLGVEISYNHKVTDLLLEKNQGDFAAVFLACGAHLGKNIAVPMSNPCKVLDAVDYLRGVAFDQAENLGSHLVIYGGGNTAIDVARTAKRLKVAEVTIIYYRTRDKMSAFSHEIQDAIAEGVKFVFLRSIISVNEGIITLGINEIDEKGRAKNTGETENIKADSLIFALSQEPDSSFLHKIPEIEVHPNGVITVDSFFMSGYPGVFAGGDLIPYERSITIAVGHGKQAAFHIDAYLNDRVFNQPALKELIHFERLNISEEKSAKTEERALEVRSRLESFSEVTVSSTQDEILYEAGRCFSCGNCFGCGKCYAVCPVAAIDYSYLDNKVTNIDPDRCIGCNKCFKVCPCGAISMTDREVK